MVCTEDNYLLFIEPQQPPSATPVIDDLTRMMTAALRRCREGAHFRGFHVCKCGAVSGSCELFVPTTGDQTNSLAVHYLAWHRQEIPPVEFAKVVLAARGLEPQEPTETELRTPRIRH